MLKPERVNFSADDDQFQRFATSDQLDSFLSDSLVHYSTDFKKPKQQQLTSIQHSNSLDELSSIAMSSQDHQHHHHHHHEETEHEPPASAPPSLISEQVPILNENNLHQLDALALQQLAIGSNQTLSNINEDNKKTSPAYSTSLADIQKEIDRVKQMKYNRTYSSPTSSLCSRLSMNPFNGSNNNIDLSSLTNSVHFTEQINPTNRLPFSSTFITSIPESIVPASGSSTTNDNHFIPIHHIESPSLEDREVFETFHTKQTSIPGVAIRQSTNSLNRNISTSETDLLTSLHRSASKQALDNQSDHGTTLSGASDDMIFVEWDKERNLFQDYINSLRTEIRVLLQERSEYQKQMETINSNLHEHKRLNLTQINIDQTNYDLLQKSLEEKNLVLEQLQKEYENMKEKNTNLIRKVSNLRCDAKSQTGVIDELKQKITELTVDIQNHILVKRRLEISMMNLENDCKMIDAERLRLNNEIKDTHLSKQELEKLLQQANVQIAEQGSTIEMLRSDNIQIRSQLSATQRRMLQEKQQVMDYLRQIENDLVEKEQIKQRELILRKDYEKLQLIHQQDRKEIEQFNLQITQDKQKLTQLEQERLQLLKTIQNFDDKQIQIESELDVYKSGTKRLYTHFKIPFDSIQSIDQLIPMLEDRYRTEQISHARIHEIPLVQSTSPVNNEKDMEEIRRLQEDLTSMNIQVKQLDEANQAWQQYQQNQLVLLRDRLKLTDIDNLSFEDIVQQIENRFNNLNDQLIELQDVQKMNVLQQNANEFQDILRQSKDTQTDDNEEDQPQSEHKSEEIVNQTISVDNNQYEEKLATLTAQCVQLDEANRAWQLYHQTQLDNFRDKLRNNLSIEDSFSLDDIAQHIIAHLDQLQTSEKLNNDLRSESVNNDQAVQQTNVNTINELNQKLSLLKQQNDQLETEKYILNQQLEKQLSVNFNQERNSPIQDSMTSDSKLAKKNTYPTQIHEAQIHTVTPVQSVSPINNQHEQEIQQLKDNVTLLTNQCAQLDQANQAWQLYQQSQLDTFTKTIQNHLSIDDNLSLEQAAQQIVDQVNKERNDFIQQYLTLEKINEELRSESTTQLETIDELNQQLLVMKEKNEQTNDTTSSDLLAKTFDEVPITNHESGDQEEIRQLRENLVSLTSQLDEMNRAWKQYQQTQVDILRNQLENCLSIDYDGSVDEIAQQIVDQVTKEREDARQKYEASERTNNDLRSESNDNVESIQKSYTNTVNELNQELLAMKEAYEQLNTEKQVNSEQPTQIMEKIPSNIVQQPFREVPIHTSGADVNQETDEVRQLRENVTALTAQCVQLDEANRAWQLYQQTQLHNVQSKLHDYFPVDETTSFDEIAQQIIDQVTREREDSREKTDNDIQSDENLEAIRQSYMNTVNELNQELLAMKEAYDQLDNEKQFLVSELEKRSIEADRNEVKPSTEKVPSNIWREPFNEVPVHTSGVDAEQDAEELRQLRENLAAVTAQCTHLDEANRAWQLYHHTQLDSLRSKLIEYLPIDENASLDEFAQQLVDEITKEREDFNNRFQAIEKTNEDLRSESANSLETIKQSYMNTVNELNQELVALKEAYEQLDNEKQVLASEIEKRSIETDQSEIKRTTERVPSSIWKEPFREVPIHTSGVDAEKNAEEVQQLRENVAALTAQCAQLDEANRAWQLFQQTQVDNFRSKLHDCLSIDNNASFDEIAQQIVDQVTREREDSREKTDNDLQSDENLESVRQSYMNTVNELNQELLALKEAFNQLDNEKQVLVSELGKRSIEGDRNEVKRTTERVPSSIWKEPFREVPIHTSGVDVEQNVEEVQQLRENVAALTAQCAQLDEANRAWQLYQRTQLDNFRTKLIDHLAIDENGSLDGFAEQIIDQFTKQREDLTEKYGELEKVIDNLRSESTTDLERVKQSCMNTVNELNQELLALKEAYEQLDMEKQDLINELERRPVNAEFSPIDLSHEVPLQTSDVNAEQENEEMKQLRENFAVLTSQYSQLNEANQAWQGFHQSELNNFRTKIQDCIQIDDNSSFDEIAQQIVDQITKEREDFSEQYQALEKTNNDLQSESIEEKKNFLIMKEQYEEILHKNEKLINEIENQGQDKETIDTTNSTLLEQHTEMSQLRENLRSLTVQFDETSRSWEQFERTQFNQLKTFLPFSTKTSLEDIIQDIILHITHLREEIDFLKENEQQSNNDKIEQDLISLQNQCTQLDNANRAWQIFYDNQIDLLKNTFKNYIEFDNNNINFEDIIQLIVTEIDSNDIEQYKQQLNELQETNNLLMSTNQNLTYRLNQLERSSSPFGSQENFKQVRRTPTQEVQIHTVTPVQSASSPNIREDELQQLRNNLSTLTAQCAQLDEANRAWQQYHQSQLEIFRKQLQDSIFFNENLTLEQIGQEIIVKFDQLDSTNESLNKQLEDYQLKESTFAQLNQNPVDVNQECEEFREQNTKLILSLQQIEQQLEEHQQQNALLHSENQQLQIKLNESEQRSIPSAFQRVDSQRDNAPIHNIDHDRDDEIRQLRSDLVAASTHCLQLEEANRAWQIYQHDQIESFTKNLQEKIPTFNQIENPSLDSIAKITINYLDQLNNHKDYLIQQNDSLKDEIRLHKNEIERPSSADGGKRMFRRLSQDKYIREAQIHTVTPVQSASPINNQHEQEIQQLKDNVTLLTNQCAQLDQANQAWQLYQQSQLDTFTKTIQNHLSIDDNLPLEQAGQQIVYQINKERNDFIQQYLTLEKINDELRSESTTQLETIDELNQQLLDMKEKNEQTNDTPSSNSLAKTFDEVPISNHESGDQEEIRQLRENLVSLTSQLDEMNRAWKQYQETQVDILRNQLENCLSIDYDGSVDEIAQQIVDQVTKEREDARQKYEALEKTNNDLRSEDNSESIRESYVSTVNELNQELLTLKEAYDQLDNEKQFLVNELEKRSIEANRNEIKPTTEKVPSNVWREPFNEVPIHTSGVDAEQDAEEIRQLQENLAAVTAQCAHLDEANRAWQLYQHTQLNNLRNKLIEYLPIDENASFDEFAQQLVDEITKEREDFNNRFQAIEKDNEDLRSESANSLETIKQSYMNTVNELNQELLALKEAYEQLDNEKQVLASKIEKRSIETDQNEIKRTTERVPSSIWKEPFREVPIHTSGADAEQNVEEVQQLRENVATLTAQCAQLDEANRAWQLYQQTQVDNFRVKLQDCLSIDNNASFDEIAQQIIDQVTREREDSREKYEALEKTDNDIQSDENLESIRQSYMNTVKELNQELLALKEAFNHLDNEKQFLVSELEKRSIEGARDEVKRTTEKVPSNIWKEPFREVPIHTSGVDSEQEAGEVQQLRENVSALTAQCVQLDEANHAWQLYQQTQLDNFRTKLMDHLAIDENGSLDDIAEQILDQLAKQREDYTEKYEELQRLRDDLRSEAPSNIQSIEQPSAETVYELTEELLNLRNQYEELEKMNKQLILEKESFSNQLQDRSIVVGHHSAFESTVIEEETPIESKQESELQSSSSPTETDEIDQIRSDLALITSQFTELTKANENDLNSFRTKLQNWIFLSPNCTLDEIAEQLHVQFEQQVPPETNENETQTIEPSEKVHIAIETTRLTYENQQTQIDSIDMIDQQIQTESLLHIWSMGNDENLFNSDEDDDRLQDYIDEITSLSPLDLSHRLNKECEQILSKNNFEKTSHPNLELNHLALITIYSLYNQHLTDDAKQLYNDTVIRALKQEYELINNEKSDYMDKYLNEINTTEKKYHQLQSQYDDLLEQNELERLHAKQSIDELKNKYEFNLYNLHQENEKLKFNYNNLENNYQETQEGNYKQLENEYQKLRNDYNEIINENELLKDYNSQMYQTNLQDKDPNLHDIEIQCNLSEENQSSSSWNNNDWNEDNTNPDLSIQEEGSNKLSNEEEINRLKAIIEEIQIENQFLKELNSQNMNTDSSIHQSVCVDNYVQTESENEQIEDNDWNAQFTPLQIPSNESNLSSIIKQTIDNETQTDEQSQDKLVQVNNKLKRALQTIKDKIHQAVIERSDLFSDISDDTIERLDHLISTIESQTIEIDRLQNERENLLERNQQLEQDIQTNTDMTSFDQRLSNDDFTQTDFNQDEQITNAELTMTNRLLSCVSETIDNETQTEEQSQDKLAQVNNKLKRALQNIKDKIHQAVIERSDLFSDVGDDTIERLDHLISTIGYQAIEIDRLQNEHDQLQNSLKASQYQIDNEHAIKTEQLVTASSNDDISQSTINDYENQIKQFQQKLSQNEDERSLLRERLNEVEIEFRNTLDEHASTTAIYEEQLQSLVQERNALVEQQQQQVQSMDNQREIEQLQEELAQLKQIPVTSNEDIQSLQQVIQEQGDEIRDLNEKYFALINQIETPDELDKQKKETEERLSNYENQIEHLIREHTNLLEEVQKKSVSTIDNESQTDDQQHDKLAQINTKLKRALQILKEKIHRIVTERPDLFVNIGNETSERLDHLISTVEHQATQIDIIQTERDQLEEQLRNEIQELQSSLEACQYQIENERPIRTEQLVTAAAPSDDRISQSTIEDYEKQIKQLQQKLSQNEDERSLLRERLNEVEIEFRNTLDEHASTTAMYEEQLQSLVQERNALVEKQIIQSTETQHEIERLQQELSELTQPSATQSTNLFSDEEIQSLKDDIEQKSEELRDLSEKYLTLSSQFDFNVDLQLELDRQRKEAEERFVDYKNQIENLTNERTNLVEQIQKVSLISSVQTVDHEKQTTVSDQQQDKLTKMNTKFKRALQTFKEKINRIVTERPDLFANIGEDTTERLDHLISTVEHQTTQINILQTEHNEVEEQLRNEVRELQGSVEAYRYQIENERPIRTEQLVTAAAPSDDHISQSTIEDYEKQIKQLQQKLSQNEDERSLLRERLNEVEIEFRKTFDEHASTTAMYEEQLQSVVQERNALVEQQTIQSAQTQDEIEQLQKELAEMQQSNNDIESLNEIIEEKSKQVKYWNEKYTAISSQLEVQVEFDREKEAAEEQLTDYKNQIEDLSRKRANLLEEIRKLASSSVQTVDNEKQTTVGDQQQDKLMKMNTKFKRALQTLKEKINRIVTERPDLFADIGEDTTERLDHLISTVEHQATQINILQTERNELQSSFDLYRQQIDNENLLKLPTSVSSLIHQTESEPVEVKQEIQSLQTSNDNQWNDWSIHSPHQIDTKLQSSSDEQEPSVTNRIFGFFKNVTSPWTEETPTNDWNNQNSPLEFPSDESQQIISSSSSSIDNLIQLIKNKIQQITSEYPNLFPNTTDDILNNLDQFISIIKNLQNQINDYQKPIKIQTDTESSITNDQRISRRVFEQEMLAWTKESERLKQFVKQIQIENKKLQDIILKFEPIIHDYMHENERLKQENQQFSFLSSSSSSLNIEQSTLSDMDICYLTLKWLTYEVAQRTFDTTEQSLLITTNDNDNNQSYLKQRLIETERQMKSIRIQNQKLKKQLETYTIQFKHIQHEINTKNQELSTLKNEIDKLRTSETQYRLEVDRLKVDLQCDQVKFQQTERQLIDLKFERTNIDDTNNLHELLELKERELNALKDKLDYTIQAHQLELQEAIKANQFSLDNVQRFEQLDQQNQVKRKELEKRLGKICKIVRPLIDSQYLFREELFINIDELQQLITDTEAEERVINSLGPIRDCLGLLESQMKELHDNLIENHSRRSKKTKDRFSSSENQWELTYPIPEFQEASQNFNSFLDSSSSSSSIDLDVRLCLDDLLYEIIVRTTMK